MTRYLPARYYLWSAITAAVLAVATAWFGWTHPLRIGGMALALLPSALFVLTAAALFVVAFRPAIEVREGYMTIGRRIVPWMDIRRVDPAGWLSPLIVRLTLFDDSRLTLVYPGDLDSCNDLLRHVRRLSRDALIDGVPYRQYWGEVAAQSPERKAIMGPRYRVLRPEDEAEVERLYQRLKTVGNLDQKNSSDES